MARQILEYEITDIYKNYKNNIELNFVNKINQFINRSLNVRETRLAINRITNIKWKKIKMKLNCHCNKKVIKFNK